MAVLGVALGLCAGPAAAAPGDLLLAKCIGPVSRCSPTAPSAALDGAWDVAVTPDQRHLYATGYDSNSISHFTLDAAGSPTYAGCIGTLLGCTGLGPPALTADARELVVSADSRHLYVASEGGDAVVHFTLDAVGTPAFANCVGNTAGCAPASPAGALADVGALVLSGDNLYAAAYGAGAVSHLKLDGAGNPSRVGGHVHVRCARQCVGRSGAPPDVRRRGQPGRQAGLRGRLPSRRIGHLTIEQPPPAAQAPVEQTPTAPPPAPPARFGTATLVTLSLAAARIPARGPLRVRVVNRNAFRVTGRLSGRTVRAGTTRRVTKRVSPRLRVR